MDIEKALNKDAQKYQSLGYKIAKSKTPYFEETIRLFQDTERDIGVFVSYNNETLLFTIPCDEKRLKFAFDPELNDEQYGSYQFNSSDPTVRLNKKIIDNGNIARLALIHELVHGSQEEICKLRDLYQKESLHYQFLTTMMTNISDATHNSIFGMNIHGRVYVDGSAITGNRMLDNMNDAFYRLSITERYAFAAEKQYANDAAKDFIDTRQRQYNRAIQTIRDRYMCYNMSEHQICELIDKVSINVYFGQKPTTPLETAIMYDFVAAISHQQGHLSDLEYRKTADRKFVSYQLAEWNLQHKEWEVPLGAKTMAQDLPNINQYYYVNEIADVPPEQQLNNPKLWAYAIANHGELGAALVFDPKAFLDWCMSKDNDLSDSHMDEIAKYMGEEFSAKSRSEAISKLQELENSRAIAERSIMAEQYSFGIERNYDANTEIDRAER